MGKVRRGSDPGENPIGTSVNACHENACAPAPVGPLTGSPASAQQHAQSWETQRARPRTGRRERGRGREPSSVTDIPWLWLMSRRREPSSDEEEEVEEDEDASSYFSGLMR